MSDQLLRLDDAGLEAALRDLGSMLAYPVAPSLVEAVHARIATMPAPRSAWWERLLPPRGTFRRSAVLALAALLLLAAAAAAVRFGVPGVRFVFEGPVTSPPPGATPASSQSPAPLGSTLGLGEAVTLDDARAAADFPVALPSDPTLGAPDGVYLDRRIPGGHVALVWTARSGIPAQGTGDVAVLLAEFAGRVDQDYFQKVIHGEGGATSIDPVTVGPARGWWLAGDPHLLYYLDRTGAFLERPSRLVGNVLIWERDGVTFRLESGLDLADALRIAESVG
jgi:hypothetical protein